MSKSWHFELVGKVVGVSDVFDLFSLNLQLEIHRQQPKNSYNHQHHFIWIYKEGKTFFMIFFIALTFYLHI